MRQTSRLWPAPTTTVNNDAQRDRRAKAVAAQNGYTTDAGQCHTVNVAINTSNGASVKVDINAPHQNNFASVVGMSKWTVSTTATAIAAFRIPSRAQHRSS